MTYHDAKEFLKDASGMYNGLELTPRLLASPGALVQMDTSTAGDLPNGDSFGDQILRALLVVRRHLVGPPMMERELAGILVELAVPIRLLAAEEQNANTRIPQISLALDMILHGGFDFAEVNPNR